MSTRFARGPRRAALLLAALFILSALLPGAAFAEQPCAHPSWTDGVCDACGAVCLHPEHDPDSALCLTCGAQCVHRRRHGICVGCGKEADLHQDRLPERYFTEPEHRGTVEEHLIPAADNYSLSMRVYVPWGYSEDGAPYNVLLMFHGLGDSARDVTDRVHQTRWGDIQCTMVYDRLIEEHECEPFLVASVSFYEDFMNTSSYDFTSQIARYLILPYLAQHFHTYMGGGSEEEIRAARDHIAMGGNSAGSRIAFNGCMRYALDLSSNYLCLSGAPFGPKYLGQRVDGLKPDVTDWRDLDLTLYCALGNTEKLREEYSLNYEILTANCRKLRDGDTCFYQEIDGYHSWDVWCCGIYNGMQLLFPPETGEELGIILSAAPLSPPPELPPAA